MFVAAQPKPKRFLSDVCAQLESCEAAESVQTTQSPKDSRQKSPSVSSWQKLGWGVGGPYFCSALPKCLRIIFMVVLYVKLAFLHF